MNRLNSSPFFVLLADDDEDDRLLAQDAMDAAGFGQQCKIVEDGEQLLQFLRGEGKFAKDDADAMPSVILLDLNMPILDGRDTLRQLKEDAFLKRIPVVIFSTSNNEEDITQGYELGASSYMVKPNNFDTLVEMMETFGHYWSDYAVVPNLAH
jgi:two-component system response regulator